MKTSRQDRIDVHCDRSSLVAHFTKANPPVVWRYDLQQNSSFTLALQGEGGVWDMGIVTLAGDFTPVARFALREDADQALQAVSDALAEGRNGWLLKGLRVLGLMVLALLIVQFGLSALVRVMHPVPVLAPSEEMPMLPPVVESKPEPPPQGVPLPADEVLQPPSP